MSYTTLVMWIMGLAYAGACIWLVLVVLIQEGKSGGMAGMDTAAQSPQALTDTLGVSGAEKGLFRMTTVTATIFFCLAVALTVVGNRQSMEGGTLDLESETVELESAPLTTTDAPIADVTNDAAPADTETPQP